MHNPFKKEAEQCWGKKTVERSEQIVKGWGKEKFAEIAAQGETINRELASLVGKPVDSSQVQAAIGKHFRHIIQFYDPSWDHLKIYRGLATMYVEDERFARNYTKRHPKMAEFMRDAMIYYCDHFPS